ncbi:regulator of (H+)-ATPase in vacuolar membrane [Recurvomyces mirabilis]|uniref:Regulator of (H+)-ATPase in vacuolar membrane n=1 Tax=Recurvomyces mirabilis TaxID=574656 RepID=A0AAE0WK72_9PEZI|nr:regulator of (H+)-ATPase in vacuolar membrane [Recurvomyces mirabilis]KAK5153249.1 regulator of (H+)-ATPase in vacuolar membrane [Recurvomyces mirabilis]
MPSTSPGPEAVPPKAAAVSSSDFAQILPGAPTASVQATATFIFRHKRYVTYITSSQLNILTGPTKLVQALAFAEGLVAVAVESNTGKIAVASKSQVYVLEPIAEGWTKVWWEKSLCLCLCVGKEGVEDEASYLSWGSEGELLVGGSKNLSLFSTIPSSRTTTPAVSPVDGEAAVEERKALWSKPVASAIQYVALCPSANVIASCSWYDRLVKIWRRLSFEEGLFDHTYLAHPAAVTHLEWRPLDQHMNERRGSSISGRHDEDPEVLWTIATDGVLRIWRMGGMHDADIMTLHTAVDLVGAIPQSPTLNTNGTASHSAKPPRYAFIIPASSFSAAVNAALGRRTNGKISHSLEHLKDVITRSPDVIVTLDGHGRMSAWGVQSIGHKRRPETPSAERAFHIAHAEDLGLTVRVGKNMRFQTWFADDAFHLVAHSFDGHVQWWRGDVETFFSPSVAGGERLRLEADWSGHDRPLAGAIASTDGELITWSKSSDISLWSRSNTGQLAKKGGFSTQKTVYAASCSVGGKLINVAHDEKVALYRTDSKQVDSLVHDLSSENGLQLAELGQDDNSQSHVLYNRTTALFFREVADEIGDVLLEHVGMMNLDNQCLYHFSAVSDDEVMYLAVDLTGTLRRQVIPTPRTETEDELDMPISTNETIETGLQQPSLLEANVDLAVAASGDGNRFVIFDLRDGYMEYEQDCSQAVEFLKLYKNAAGNQYLAVGYKSEVEILVQGRYEHHREAKTWCKVKQVSIENIGLSITTLAWCGDGMLAVVAGSVMFITSETVLATDLEPEVQERLDLDARTKDELKVTEVSARLAQPAPVWHPRLLTHLLYHGSYAAAVRILRQLSERLKFWSEGEYLHSALDLPHDAVMEQSNTSAELDDATVRDILEQLAAKKLPAISDSEQRRLQAVVEALHYISKYRRGLDDNALHYLFSFNLQLSYMAATSTTTTNQPNGTSHIQQPPVPQMSWHDITFASHSSTQQPLLDILIQHYDNKLAWPIARALGLTTWLSDREALATVFESLAQSAYRSTSPPDPTNAALFFLALHKKATLLALWRIATWHKEQRSTTNFLKRDFSLPEAKTAARKNAYALMGKRRFEYAAAFFLLADDAGSAVGLLAGQCGDIGLAVAVARLYGGEQSECLQTLVRQRLRPQAEKENDRWLMSWCFSALKERHEAANALIKPLDGVRNWQQDDPRTMVLYRHLRKDRSEQEEYRAVLRAARILRRMGFWVLALEMVKGWEFKHVSAAATHANGKTANAETTTNGIHHERPSAEDLAANEPSLLDSFSSVPDSAPAVKAVEEPPSREAQAAALLTKLQAKKAQAQQVPTMAEKEKPKPPPTQFKEPDANSLLDSFGF